MGLPISDGHAQMNLKVGTRVPQLGPLTASSVWQIPIVPLQEVEGSPQEWLVEGLIPAEGTTMVSGPSESGKTTLMLALVRAAITGQPFAGDKRFPVNPPSGGGDHCALWLGYDGGWIGSLNRRLGADPLAPEAGKRLRVAPDMGKLLTLGEGGSSRSDWTALGERLAGEGFSLVVIDHLYAVADGLDLNNPSEAAALIRGLRQLEGQGIVPLVIHHASSKGGRGTPMGSSTLIAHRRAGLEVKKNAKSTTVAVHANDAPEMTLSLDRLAPGPVTVRSFQPANHKRVESAREDSEVSTPETATSQERSVLSVVLARNVLEQGEQVPATEEAAATYLKAHGIPATRQKLRTAKDKKLLKVEDGKWCAGDNFTG